MMKKHLVKGFLLLLFALWAPAFQAAPGHFVAPANLVTVDLSCPEPPPSGFHAVSNTYNSITLKWVENTPGLYYWITGHDNTTNTGLGTVVVTGDEYTWGSLPYPHDFTFTIGASSCVEGPPGGTASANGKTGIIIVDDLVLFSPCNNSNISLPPGLMNFKITVGAAQFANQGVLDNMYTANFSYQSDPCQFAVGYDEGESKVYLEKVPESDPRNRFFTQCSQNNQVGSIYYKLSAESNIEVLRIDQLEVDNMNPAANMRINLLQALSTYTYCNCSGSPSFLNATTTSHSNNVKQALESNKRLSFGSVKPAGQVSPNPFSGSTTVRYTLDADGPIAIRLYDPMGRLVKLVENSAQQSAGSYEATVHAEDLPDGVYYLHVQTANRREVFPIVKRQ